MLKINDESKGTYSKNNEIRFKTSISRSSLCDYSEAYILFKGSITVANTGASATTKNSIKRSYLKVVLHLLTA